MKRLLMVLACCLMPWSSSALDNKGFEHLHTFSRVLHHILQYHVEPPDEEELINGAIRGLFESLDPHSSYLSSKVFQRLKSETGGRFGGLGIEVVLKRGWLTVVSPIDGSPAAAAGIKAGDRIVKVNRISTKKMNISEAVSKMRGRPGGKVVLTILRRSSRVPFDVVLHRATITVPSVRVELTEPGFPYVRITSFREQTYRDLVQAIGQIQRKGPIKGMVLDLRNNPGGLLNQAVKISDLFLRKGVIVTTKSRGKEIDRREAHDDGTQPEYPVAILVNGGSASASEIVTGALQDRRRATVLGSQTFGKGSVQTVIAFADKSALKLTIARYYTPKNRSIQAFGITPDIFIPEDHPNSEEGRKSKKRLRESTLPGHLKSKGRKQRVRRGRAKVALPRIALEDGVEDYQKAVAMAFLKNGTVSHMTGRQIR
jgi:carboxyl-terminal processing protease